jgi:hypothetical protein
MAGYSMSGFAKSGTETLELISTMKTLSVAIFALCLTADMAGARTFNASEMQSIEALTSAFLAGTMCPGFDMVDQAMENESRAIGISRDDVRSAEYSTVAEASFNAAKEKYASNPSMYCDEAWRIFGPSGTYPRRLLKLK